MRVMTTVLLGLLAVSLWTWNFTTTPQAWESFLGMLVVLIGWALWVQPSQSAPPR